MRFITTQQELHRGLSLVGHAVPGKPLQPIGAYIRAEAEASTRRVRLSARSEDLGIHCWIPASEVEESHVTLLPGALFSDFVSNLPLSPITVIAPSPSDAMSCHVRCSRISANMKNGAQDPAEFPQIPCYADGGQPLLHLDAELLKQMIAQVAFTAASTDAAAAMPGLTGINVEIGNGKAL